MGNRGHGSRAAIVATPAMIDRHGPTGGDGFLGDFEETLLITDSGPELLTDARIRTW